jgi:hypothetical protein
MTISIIERSRSHDQECNSIVFRVSLAFQIIVIPLHIPRGYFGNLGAQVHKFMERAPRARSNLFRDTNAIVHSFSCILSSQVFALIFQIPYSIVRFREQKKKKSPPKPYRVKSHNFAVKDFHHMNLNITFQVIFIAKLQSLWDLVRKKSYRK